MSENRVLTRDSVFLRMTEHIIGNLPDNTIIWDADSLSEREFNSVIHHKYSTAVSEIVIIAVSFDVQLLRGIRERNSKIITAERPLSIFSFENMFGIPPKKTEHINNNILTDSGQISEQPPASVDFDNRTVQIYSGRRLNTVSLTPKEFELFCILYENKGKSISRDEIMNKFISPATPEQGNIVEVYIYYLRKKLGKKTIESVRGEGYRLNF